MRALSLRAMQKKTTIFIVPSYLMFQHEFAFKVFHLQKKKKNKRVMK